jgi:type I restriction enzyme, R subunit
VQTLSRLNRAHPGKDTTYILDFANSTDDILKAFRIYYDTAELEDVTDPNIVYNLRAKLDATGFYDDFEVDRVAEVELNPKAKQGDLVAAISPVADRLLKRFKSARDRHAAAQEQHNENAAKDAKDERDALLLFKNDLGAFLRIYTFLSQMFDYGNTAIEKRFMFYRRLLPLLEFGREREGIDLSKVQLTHHSLKGQGKQPLRLGDGEVPKLAPLTEAGSGAVQDKEKARLAEIIERVNGLF